MGVKKMLQKSEINNEYRKTGISYRDLCDRDFR